MKLFMIRHGQTTANLHKVYAGQSDVQLTELGRQQAINIRPILKDISFDKVFSSDLVRAIDTQTLSLPDMIAETTPLLREYNVGSLEGMHFSECRARYGEIYRQTTDYSSFGGESTSMVCSRLKTFITTLEDKPWDNVAVFAHNGIMKCMLRLVLNTDFDGSAVNSNNCSIHVFSYENKQWKLLAWNYMGEI